MKVVRLHLLRHGLTQGNFDGIYMGSGTDMPLCAEGESRLRELKGLFTYPQVDTVFCSPMQRAVQSADILFPDAKNKIILGELRECNFGEFEGRQVKELVGDTNFQRWLDPTSGYVPQKGESNEDFHARCRDSLRKMLEYMLKAHIEEAACMTHGGVIMSMMGQCALPNRPAEMWMADAGCGYTVLCTPTMWMRDGLVEAKAVVPAGYFKETAEESDYTLVDAPESDENSTDGSPKA